MKKSLRKIKTNPRSNMKIFISIIVLVILVMFFLNQKPSPSTPPTNKKISKKDEVIEDPVQKINRELKRRQMKNNKAHHKSRIHLYQKSKYIAGIETKDRYVSPSNNPTVIKKYPNSI